jgi:hypothetical protein
MFSPGEECYLQDEYLSPSRALHAAMLRSRFAGTIVKAQQKALLDHVIFQNYVVNFVDCLAVFSQKKLCGLQLGLQEQMLFTVTAVADKLF